MTTDAQGREPDKVRPDIWTLPDIIKVSASLVRFQKPLIRYDGLKRIKHEKAVKLIVNTSAPLPERALSPVLMVGDVVVDDYEILGKNLYRFYAFENENLKEESTIQLMWPTRQREPEQNRPHLFRLGEERR